MKNVLSLIGGLLILIVAVSVIVVGVVSLGFIIRDALGPIR